MGITASQHASLSDVQLQLRGLEFQLSNLEVQQMEREAFARHADAMRAHTLGECVTLFGALLRCRQDVQIVVGPVLGVIDDTSAVVLVEIDVSAVVWCNVCVSDPATCPEGRVVQRFAVKCEARRPTSFKIRRLTPGQRYFVCFGGVNRLDAERCTARFVTWEGVGSGSGGSLTLLLVADDQPQQLAPGAPNMWEEVRRAMDILEDRVPSNDERDERIARFVADGGRHAERDARAARGAIPLEQRWQRGWGDDWATDPSLRRRIRRPRHGSLFTLHLGGQVHALSAPSLFARTADADEWQRRAYRHCWAYPIQRNVLARGAHIMIPSARDVSVGRRAMLEYQRQLWRTLGTNPRPAKAGSRTTGDGSEEEEEEEEVALVIAAPKDVALPGERISAAERRRREAAVAAQAVAAARVVARAAKRKAKIKALKAEAAEIREAEHAHVQTFGRIALVCLDLLSPATGATIRAQPFPSGRQWSMLRRTLAKPELRVIVLAMAFPLVALAPDEVAELDERFGRLAPVATHRDRGDVDDQLYRRMLELQLQLQNRWCAPARAAARKELLHRLFHWQRELPCRKVIIVAGGLGVGVRTLIRRHARVAKGAAGGGGEGLPSPADDPLSSGAFRASVVTPGDTCDTIEQITVGSITAETLPFLPRLAGTLDFDGVSDWLDGTLDAPKERVARDLSKEAEGEGEEEDAHPDSPQETYSYVHSPQIKHSGDGHGFAMLRVNVEAPGGEWEWSEREDASRGAEAGGEKHAVSVSKDGGADAAWAAEGGASASSKEAGASTSASALIGDDLAHVPQAVLAAEVDLTAHREARARMKTTLETAFLPLRRDDDALFGVAAEAVKPKASAPFQQLLLASSSAECVPRVVLGPVLGEITAYTVTILIEVDRVASVECVLVDAADGTMIRRALQLWANQPRAFHFDELRPEHRYCVHFEGVCVGSNDPEMENDECAAELSVNFTTLALQPETIRLILVSGDDPHAVAAEGFVNDSAGSYSTGAGTDEWGTASKTPASPGPADSLWQTINTSLTPSDRRDGTNAWGEPLPHTMLHIGGQANVRTAFPDAQMWLRETRPHEWSPHHGFEGNGNMSAASLQLEAARRTELARESLRAVYRTVWNLAERKAALRSVSHLMMWSEKDICEGFAQPSTVVARRVPPELVRLSREVYHEYQRQLWDAMNVSSNGYLRVMQHRRQRDPIRLAQAVSTATMEIRTDPGTLIDYRGTAPADAITAGVSHSLTENDLSKDSDEIKELNADATGAEEVLDAIRVGAGVPEVMRALAQSDRWADDLEEHHVHRIGEAALFFVDIRSASVQASGVQVQGGGPLLSERQWYGLSTTMLSPSLKALVLVSEVPFVQQSPRNAQLANMLDPLAALSTQPAAGEAVYKSTCLWSLDTLALERMLMMVFDWKAASTGAASATGPLHTFKPPLFASPEEVARAGAHAAAAAAAAVGAQRSGNEGTREVLLVASGDGVVGVGGGIETLITDNATGLTIRQIVLPPVHKPPAPGGATGAAAFGPASGSIGQLGRFSFVHKSIPRRGQAASYGPGARARTPFGGGSSGSGGNLNHCGVGVVAITIPRSGGDSAEPPRTTIDASVVGAEAVQPGNGLFSWFTKLGASSSNGGNATTTSSKIREPLPRWYAEMLERVNKCTMRKSVGSDPVLSAELQRVRRLWLAAVGPITDTTSAAFVAVDEYFGSKHGGGGDERGEMKATGADVLWRIATAIDDTAPGSTTVRGDWPVLRWRRALEYAHMALFSGLERQSLVLPSQDTIARVLMRLRTDDVDVAAAPRPALTLSAFTAICQASFEEAAVARLAVREARAPDAIARRAAGREVELSTTRLRP